MTRLTFASRLCNARHAAGLTQQETAKRAKISNVHLNRLEHGHHVPTTATLKRLAKVLKVSMEALIK